jgi:WD40 repeat protein
LADSQLESVNLEAYFDKQGRVQGILEQYLESALDELPDQQQGPAVGLLSKMVTSAGTRNVISGEDVVTLVESEDGLPPALLKETLESLESKSKLVRREHRRGVYFYEITSEFLVPWIQKKAKERSERRRIEATERALDEERRRAEAQAKIARRFRWFAIAMTIISIAVVILLAVIFKTQGTLSYLREKQAEQELEIARTDEIIARATHEADSTIKVRVASAEREAESKIDSANEVASQRIRFATIVSENARREAAEAREFATENKKRSTLLFRLSLERALAIQAPLQRWSDMDTLGILLAYQAYALHQENLERIAALGEEEVVEVAPALDPASASKQYNALRVSLNALPGSPAGPEVIRERSRIRCVAYSPVERSFAFGTDDGRISFKSEKDTTPSTIGNATSSVRALSFRPDGRLLASGDNGALIHLWDMTLSSNIVKTLTGHADRVLSLAFHPARNFLASGGGDRTVRLWDVTDGTSRLVATMGTTVRSVRFDQSGDLLIAASADGDFLVWGGADSYREVLNSFKVNGRVRSLDLHPSGTMVAVAGEGSTVWLWNLKSGEKQALQQRHTDGVTAVRFSGDGKLLASAGFDGSLRLWFMDNPAREPIVLPDGVSGGHAGTIWSLDFSPHNDRLVSVGSDEAVRVWLTQTAEMFDMAHNRVRRNMTEAEWNRFIGVDIPYSEGHHPISWSSVK